MGLDLRKGLVFMDFPDGSEGKVSGLQCWRPGFDPWVTKEMATDSSILDWEIPWTEEAGKLQSVGS